MPDSKRTSQQCKKCRAFFQRFQCGANIGQGECDCPKCQGYCKCPDLSEIAERGT